MKTHALPEKAMSSEKPAERKNANKRKKEKDKSTHSVPTLDL